MRMLRLPVASIWRAIMVAHIASSVLAFDCALTASSIKYDLTPLGTLRQTSHMSSTPPTSNEAKILMDLCGTIGSEDGVEEEDRCPSDTKLCLKMINHKSSSSEPARVVSVIPMWPGSLNDESVKTTPLGRNGQDGLRISVNGPEYAGQELNLNLTLLCDRAAEAAEPTFISLASRVLSLEWASPDACPRDGLDEGTVGDGEGESSSGSWGFWGFISFLFWIGLVGLLAYFAIGIFYNHQQYSARGWDLLPHRDFWRELPTLISDLFQHLFAGLRGSGSRGGYSSLG